MKTQFYLTILISLTFLSCEKDNVTPQEITYPETHNGKINLLAIQSDTFYVDTTVQFFLAANVPANRSIKIVLQPLTQPATHDDWAGFGMNAFPSNPHLEWDFSEQRIIYNSLDEEFEEDKFCTADGIILGAESWWSTTGIIHVIIYEDQTDWMTRYITLVPI